MLIWIVELPIEDDAAVLVTDAQGRSTDDGRFCVGIAAGPLFALLVGGSWVRGVEPFESAQSVAELGQTIRPLMLQSQ